MTSFLSKIAADFSSQLAAALNTGGTSTTLLSVTDDDGVALANGRWCFTLDGDNSKKEHISCTINGVNVTNIKSISRQGVETSGVARDHRIGCQVVITDWASIKFMNDLLSGAVGLDAATPLAYDGAATLTPGSNQLATVAYADALSIAGAAKATNSTFGIVKLSVAAVDSNIPIALGENDGRVLTQAENDAAAGAGATAPSSSNKFVTNSIIPAGVVLPFAGSSIPTDWLACDGTAKSRTTYAVLFAAIGTTYGAGDGSTTFNLPNLGGRSIIGAGTATKVATFASRSSNVITVTGLSSVADNEFQTGVPVVYATSGSVITGLTNAATYYVIRVSNTTFSLASSLANARAGTAIALSSDGSGTQTFTLSLTARTLAQTGGEEKHLLTIAEMPNHAHGAAGANIPPPQTGGGSSGYLGASGVGPTGVVAEGGDTQHNNMSPYFVMNYIIKAI